MNMLLLHHCFKRIHPNTTNQQKMIFQRVPILLSVVLLGRSSTPTSSAFISFSSTTRIWGYGGPTSTPSPKSEIIQQQQQRIIRNVLYLSTTPSSKDSSADSSSTIEYNSKTMWEEEDHEEEYEDSKISKEKEEEDSPLMAEFQSWSNAVNTAIESLRKKRNSLENELNKAKGLEDTVARAQLLVSHLYLFNSPGVTSAIVQDWEDDGKEVELQLNTEKYNSASEEADALFAKARKLKRGSQVVKELLEETDRGWELLSEAKEDLGSALLDDEQQQEIDKGRLALVQNRLIRTSRTTNFQIPSSDGNADDNKKRKNKRSPSSKAEIGEPASNIRKMISPGGCIVLVGRNRRGNEYLSLTLARGNDIWMHSRGCPGAHVLIQNRRGSPKPTDACLQFGANLAIFYSDLRNEMKAEVTAAEPKHIQKPRGAPLGAVKLREEWKTFVGRPDDVPVSLKEARDQSGQSNYEYRTVDKAKHRRKTKQAAIEDQAKRRKKNR